MTRAASAAETTAENRVPDAAKHKTPQPDAAQQVKTLYRIMQSVENKLGGGEGVEGLYGSISAAGMQRVVTALERHTALSAASCLVDIGAGLGRPLLHAMVSMGLTSAFGVEVDAVKCQKAAAFLERTKAELARRGVPVGADMALPPITCSPMEQMETLEPATHAYSFWEGVPTEGKCAFGRLAAASATLQGVAVVQRAIRGEAPADAMRGMGFGDLTLVDTFAVSMSGSGRSFRTYVFSRVPQPAAATPAAPVGQHVAVGPPRAARTPADASVDGASAARQPTAKLAAAAVRDSARGARRAARAAAGEATPVEAAPQPEPRRRRPRGKPVGRASAADAAEEPGAPAPPATPQAPKQRRPPAAEAAQASSGAAQLSAGAADESGEPLQGEVQSATPLTPRKAPQGAATGGGRGSPGKGGRGSPRKNGVQKAASPRKPATPHQVPLRQVTLWGRVARASRSRALVKGSAGKAGPTERPLVLGEAASKEVADG